MVPAAGATNAAVRLSPARMAELTAPFSPMQWNDLFCFARPEINTLSLGVSKPSYYKQKFGEDPMARFAPQLSRMQADGFLTLSDDEIRLTHEGLLQVDRLCHEFFLPEHRQYARYT